MPELFLVTLAAGGHKFDFEGNTLLLGEGTQEHGGIAGEPVKVARCAQGGSFAGVKPGQRQQRLDEVTHALRRALVGFKGFAVFLVVAWAVEAVLRVGEHHGDGRPEFMRGVGGDAGLPGEGLVEAGEGGVQHAGKLAQFAIRVAGADALREVACGNPGCGGADVPDGAEGARGNPPSAGQPQQKDHAAGPAEQPSEAAQVCQVMADVAAHQDAIPGRGKVEALPMGSAHPRTAGAVGPGWMGHPSGCRERAGDFPAIGMPCDVIERPARPAIEEVCFVFRQTQLLHVGRRVSGGWMISRPGAVRWKTVLRRPGVNWRRAVLQRPERSPCSNNPGDALLQFLVNAAHFIPLPKPPGGEAKTGQHQRQQQPVPELLPPTDGMEEVHSMQ